MGYYKDLREYVEFLRWNGQLVTIKREINKDTELSPLVRWQLRRLPEKERKAFLFENVIDVRGRKYNGSVLVGAHAASRNIYALAMGCKPNEIMTRWAEASIRATWAFPLKIFSLISSVLLTGRNRSGIPSSVNFLRVRAV